jgi:hypothetical protein
MLANTKAYSGLAVSDLQAARRSGCGHRRKRPDLAAPRRRPRHLVYQQADLTPASYTILNFEVDDIDMSYMGPTA